MLAVLLRMKNSFYPEYALAVWASKQLGRPVKWIENRMKAILTDHHGRDNVTEALSRARDDGEFLGIRVKTTAGIWGLFINALAAGRPPSTWAVSRASTQRRLLTWIIAGVFTHTCRPPPIEAPGGRKSHLSSRQPWTPRHGLGLKPIGIGGRTLFHGCYPYQTPLFLIMTPVGLMRLS